MDKMEEEFNSYDNYFEENYSAKVRWPAHEIHNEDEPTSSGSNNNEVSSNSEDDETVQMFMSKPCCINKCTEKLNEQDVTSHLYDIRELSKPERDLVILSYLGAHRKHRDGENKRSNQEYCFKGQKICRTVFLFLHDIGHTTFTSLVKWFDDNGLTPRMHGNKGKAPPNVTAFEDVERVKQFLESYSMTHGLPLPGRMPNVKDYRCQLLPSHMSKESVYRDYVTSCEAGEFKCVCLSLFKKLWNTFLPWLKSIPPHSDLCLKCQENATKVIRAANLPETVKTERMQEALAHINLASQERAYYNTQCQESKKGNMNHISFDYAQQLTYPMNCLQVGPAFFKSARKCQLFGIANEGKGHQMNFLIDESDSIGKGTNSVLSLLHFYISHESLEGSTVTLCLHADNCSGQNKNNTNIQYWVWRTLVGLSKKIEMSYMIPGHTKFAPDRFFGMIKKHYNHSQVDTMSDLCTVVKRSSPSGRNHVQITKCPITNQRFVRWFSWNIFLNQYFNKIPSITKYHHFSMNAENPGIVTCREYASSTPVSVKILKENVNIPVDARPQEVIPSGLTLERQWYLFENIQSLCSSSLAADLVCPKPDEPKAKKSKTQDVEM